MFHQPVQSVATYRLELSRHSGASTDSRLLPLIRRPLPGTPSVTGATRSSVPSQGMCGWFQPIQASHLPSGDGVGNAKKSNPVTSTRTAPGSLAAAPSERHGDDRPGDLARRMLLAHAPDLAAVRRQHEVRVPQVIRPSR